jgi:predicted neuraminidase
MNRVIFAYLMVLAALPAVAAPRFQTQDIFPPQEQHTHSSSLVETPEGDLLACWFQGSGERTADDVVVNGARVEGGEGSWSTPFLMADTPGFPDTNPVLWINQKEELHLIWFPVLAHRWECGYLKYRLSTNYDDPGAPKWSWQDNIHLKPGEDFGPTMARKFDEMGFGEGMWAEYARPYREDLINAAKDAYKRQTGWMPRVHPTTLKSGRVLLPLYSDGFNISLIAISDDDGATWYSSEPLVGEGPTQPSLIEKRDGTIAAYIRDTGREPWVTQYSESRDGGLTWSPSVDLDIPNPDSSLEVIPLQTGEWLMVCNDRADTRARLTAYLSDDEGETWKWVRKIEPTGEPGHEYSYPSVIQVKNGDIHMTYTRKTKAGNTIAHTVVNLAWLKGE